VVVRVGNYKQDSYIGMGEGMANVAVVDDDLAALRNELWLNTDRGLQDGQRGADAKQAALKQLNVEISGG